MGIAKYNSECRKIVMRYSSEWQETIARTGRWIDFENDYKTMDPNFMESVWWVFKTLHEKGLIYRSTKIMPYSTACNTPLSNFEVQQNYQQVTDPAVTIAFHLKRPDDYPPTFVLAWTTTPWTLISNLALCVHPDYRYVELKHVNTGNHFILHESKVNDYFEPENVEVISRLFGRDLVNSEYYPLFPYFEHNINAFKILSDTYVTDTAGTGIVHNAPAFGEDDHRVCIAAGILTALEVEQYCPVDPNGRFTEEIPDFVGQHVKEADKAIIKTLKSPDRIPAKCGFLFKHSQVTHQYPYCWRSDTPLIYRVTSSWFLDVPKIKERLIANSLNSRWVPENVQTKRFLNWLENARPWNISRNRFWGNPLPVWANDDYSEVVVIGSIEELQSLTGEIVTDLHRESIDHLLIPSKNKDDPPLHRITEVLDCWFESGSMPYAQVHYPFENKEEFEKSGFPGDFIAEGLDQTRGWFYTLMVISTALFDKPAFKNLIVNGIVLAEDGKKMSKRLKNYPEPTIILDKYGADSLRLYLIDSPVVRAEPLRFSEKGVHDITKTILIPWSNAVRFLLQQTDSLTTLLPNLYFTTPMDNWIVNKVKLLQDFIKTEMDNYRLYAIVPEVVKFINSLNNHYIRFNRLRLKGQVSEKDQFNALFALYSVLKNFTRLMSPFTPFTSEYFYQKLLSVSCLVSSSTTRLLSVHYLPFPTTTLCHTMQHDGLSDTSDVDLLISVIESGRNLRGVKGVSLRTPLSELIIHTTVDLTKVLHYFYSELNVKKVTTTPPDPDQIVIVPTPDFRSLGKRLKGGARVAADSIKSFDQDQLRLLQDGGIVKLLTGDTITSADVTFIQMVNNPDQEKYLTDITNEGVVIFLNAIITPELQIEGDSRTLFSAVQQLRKRAGLVPSDDAEIYTTATETLISAVENNYKLTVIPFTSQSYTYSDILDELSTEDLEVSIYLLKT